MSLTNHERIGKAMDLLRDGLGPFVEREFDNLYKGQALTEALRFAGEDRMLAGKPIPEWDAHALIKLMWDSWNEVFRRTLGQSERTLVSELWEARNRWAHQQTFSSDDAYRVLDSAARLLIAVSAKEAEEVEKMKMDLLRQRFDEQVRTQKRKSSDTAIEGQATSTLKPWREVVTPHRDVASGRYQQAEFAADLWQVHVGEGSDEYRDPAEFFRRTYLTESLKHLLVGAVRRLTGEGGDPVVQLQTNFGGGKTHSMLALYHLFSGIAPGELAGVDALLAEAGVTTLPKAKRVVLVGNRVSPGNPVRKSDGTIVRTLWGELAWQLGLQSGGVKEAKKAFNRIAADDEKATSPGDALRKLMKDYGPCLILIDEWVAYARQLHDQSDLPAGTFETQFTFAQLLTESAKQAKNCLLVISLPASDTGTSPHAQADDAEVGGVRGREALDRLRNVVGRIESSWRPASAEEGFEIVRRRLFEPLVTSKQHQQRDLTAREFFDLYRTQQQEFPPECHAADYERRMKAAYPIHPEIFDRLYTDWSTLVKFQRTRGVLRLMAAVIHSLWEKDDKNPLILPSMIPIDDPRVQFELTRYLSDHWVPVIDGDVDGPNSLPLRLDGEIPNLGKLHACRRVARTIYLGSAPTATAAHRGIEDRRVKLGCVMPGETPAIFADALRRLASTATYLYQDGPRYWYSTQPTVTKVADDRAELFARDQDKVAMELDRRLRADLTKRGDFARVHPLPRSGADVPDDLDTRLVVLGIEEAFSKEAGSSAQGSLSGVGGSAPSSPAGAGGGSAGALLDCPAKRVAKAILESRCNSPRLYRNTLVFLAVDKLRLQDLEEAVCKYLAWSSIVDERETLNLDPHQSKQATQQMQAADSTVQARIPEAYQWLLVPTQQNPAAAPQAPIEWQAIRLTGQDALAVRASKKLKNDELLITSLGPTRLRMELDRVPLWRGNHVPVAQLVKDFAQYLYLPRVSDPSVLVESIRNGLSLLTWVQDTFGYAEAFDEAGGRYQGLRGGELVKLSDGDPVGLLVKSEVVRRQLDAEVVPPTPGPGPGPEPGPGPGPGPGPQPPVIPAPPLKARRFHGTVELEPARVGRDAGRIAEEVIGHLVGLPGAEVKVTLEIEAEIPDGAPDNVVRTVTENSRTLKFRSQGFERE
jgi:predicted AAA+ superfamily ATPase